MGAERGKGANEGVVHWSHGGETGPDRWGGLDPSFAVCDTGAEQSPIDLAGAIPAGGGGLEIRWRTTDGEVFDDGHTIQVNVAPGSGIALEGREFSLVQFHFHRPSEHTVEGERFAMEAHFVHHSREGDPAVVGVFLDSGKAHAALQAIWDAIPGVGEAPVPLSGIDLNAFLPEGGGYFRYAGSLTTPPCCEGVNWVMMTDAVEVSQGQIDAFAALYPMNARPVQPLNGRRILLKQRGAGAGAP